MLVSSIWLLVPTLVSSCVAALSISGWVQSRRRFRLSPLEWEALEPSSSLLEVDNQIVDMMNSGASSRAVLDILTQAIERMVPESFGVGLTSIPPEGPQLYTKSYLTLGPQT
jgi:hypothetical protein